MHKNVLLGPPCPFSRDKTGSHPTVETVSFAERNVLVCRHCNAELASQPQLPLLEEPYEGDPRIRLAESL